MSATIVDQLIDSPFQDLLFEAEPQDLPDLFLLLIQDPALWKRRIRSLRKQLVDQPPPPDQITGLQPVLQAIGECRLRDVLSDEEITARQVCEIADHPQALWLVGRTMKELLQLESGADQLDENEGAVETESTPPAVQQSEPTNLREISAVERAEERIQFVCSMVYSRSAGSETAAASAAETRMATEQPQVADRLLDPLPWLLLWKQPLKGFAFVQLHSAWQLASQARDRHQAENSVLPLSGLATYAAEAMHIVGLPAVSLTVDFDADAFCRETARDLVLAQPNDSFPWQTDLKQWLLNQDWQHPDELWALQRPSFGSSGQDVHRLLTRLHRELTETYQRLRGPISQKDTVQT